MDTTPWIMLARCFSVTTIGIEPHQVEVEVDLSQGLPRYFLVGLPDRAIHESRDRIESALRQNNHAFPRGRITVNLAPVGLPKVGSSFDLPIAVALLASDKRIPRDRLGRTLFTGELALDGRLRPVKGTLSMARLAKKMGHEWLVVPKENGLEASVVDGVTVIAASTLKSVLAWLKEPSGHAPVEPPQYTPPVATRSLLDFQDVAGQETVKRALEVAAAGGHNVVLVGPPGSGKTMMARRLPGILPPMTQEEAVETTQVHSVAGLLQPGLALLQERPFRAPHHTVTDIALIGGHRIPVPGEISLANHGILFLDELPEFRRRTLDLLRQPIEDGHVVISRSKYRIRFPSRVMLVASMNPSPGGGWPGEDQSEVSQSEMRRYLSRISGPFMDRMDMHVEVPSVKYEQLKASQTSERSEAIRTRVVAARNLQTKRFDAIPGVHCNAQMRRSEIRHMIHLAPKAERVLRKMMKLRELSARAHDRILKMARTIADLDGSGEISDAHVSEAVGYRVLDRNEWWFQKARSEEGV